MGVYYSLQFSECLKCHQTKGRGKSEDASQLPVWCPGAPGSGWNESFNSNTQRDTWTAQVPSTHCGTEARLQWSLHLPAKLSTENYKSSPDSEGAFLTSIIRGKGVEMITNTCHIHLVNVTKKHTWKIQNYSLLSSQKTFFTVWLLIITNWLNQWNLASLTWFLFIAEWSVNMI